MENALRGRLGEEHGSGTMRIREVIGLAAILVFGLAVIDRGVEGQEAVDSPETIPAVRASCHFLVNTQLRPLNPRSDIRFPSTVPKFLKERALSGGVTQAFEVSWRQCAADRTFEAEARTLEDFSNIDIPIKFPKTIGRVIGQGANLNVSGSEQITFGGQTRYRVNEPLTERGRRSRFPTLDMKQHLKIDLKGTVGEKIHVMVHHDSDIETPLENRIKLRYEGDDDEIVQSIEMGNTNLAIPGSQFVSYSGQQQGLFGAKLLGKLGPLDITAIASKQEGRTAAASFEGAATKDSVILWDMDFVRNKYFFMIAPHQVSFAADFENIQVYLDDGNGNNNEGEGTLEGYAFLDPLNLAISMYWRSTGTMP
jgi:hypothetical protein